MVYGSCNIWYDRQNFLVLFGYFLPIHPHSPWWHVISKFWKVEKNTCRYYHFTHVCLKWQSHDVWFLSEWVNEIWSPTDRIFCHFECLTDIILFFILDYFLLLPLLTTKKKKKNQRKLKKKQKTNVDIIILHMWTINDNHM